MTLNYFVIPFYRMMCVTVFILCASIMRKLKVSNTMKLLIFISLQIFLLQGTIQGVDYLWTHYSSLCQIYRIDADIVRILNTELNITYQWFIDNHYIFVSFTMSVLTSRFIDWLI